MRRTTCLVTCAVLLGLGQMSAAAEDHHVTKSSRPTTRLYVRTIPPGADIHLDGKERGKSPQLFNVPPGVRRMTVEVELDGHGKRNRVVQIEGGRIIRVEFRFAEEAQPPAEPVAVPQTPRILLYLVVGKDRITFQGKDTTWDELAKLLEKVPASKNTVLHIARDPGEMTAEHWDQAVGRAIKLIKRFGFGNLSDVGVHPLGFSGPAKHHSVCVVVGKDRMTFQGEDTTWEELPKLLEKIADRQRTVLNFARAPGELTVKQWHQARSRAVGLAERFGFDHLSDIGEHPLGSKWEETRTLSDAMAQSPTQALIWERVMHPPKGWTIEKSFIVPPDQTAAIGKKLGGPIKKLSNTIYSAHGQRVQVNVIECWTNADAEDIHKSVLAMKGDPAYALEFGDTIVEFVGTFDVAFAKRAARELLQPQADEPKGGSFGPAIESWLQDMDEGDTRQALDLDHGKLFALPEQYGDWSRQRRGQWLSDQGVELLAEHANGWSLVAADPELTLRAIPDVRWEEIHPRELANLLSSQVFGGKVVEILDREGLRFYMLGAERRPPVSFVFQTRKGRLGILQIVEFTDQPKEVKLRYKLVKSTEGTASAGRLDLRIAPTRGGDAGPAVRQPEVQRYIEDLRASGPEVGLKRGDPFAWFPLDDQPRPPLITAARDGQTFVLLANTAEHTMLSGSSRPWAVVGVTVYQERQGRPAIGVEMDDAGGRQLGELTENHLNCPLAILINDRVVSAPTVKSKIARRVQITGSFEVREARELAQALMAGMVQPAEPPQTAKTQIESLSAALRLYHLHVGSYPSTRQNLKALWQRPVDLPDSANWEGPYLKGPVPSDPWGRRYRYQSADTFGGDMYVWSAGPDGVDGTGDDIGNWEPGSERVPSAAGQTPRGRNRPGLELGAGSQTGSRARESADRVEIELEVTENGEILLSGQILPLEQVEQTIEDRLEAGAGEVRVVVRAAASADFAHITRVIVRINGALKRQGAKQTVVLGVVPHRRTPP